MVRPGAPAGPQTASRRPAPCRRYLVGDGLVVAGAGIAARPRRSASDQIVEVGADDPVRRQPSHPVTGLLVGALGQHDHHVDPGAAQGVHGVGVEAGQLGRDDRRPGEAGARGGDEVVEVHAASVHGEAGTPAADQLESARLPGLPRRGDQHRHGGPDPAGTQGLRTSTTEPRASVARAAGIVSSCAGSTPTITCRVALGSEGSPGPGHGEDGHLAEHQARLRPARPSWRPRGSGRR